MTLRARAPVARPLPDLARRHQGQPAGLVTRCAANAVDFLVTLGLLAAVYVGAAATSFVLKPRGFRFPQPSLPLTIVVGSVLACGYFAVSWMLSGRTYGDHLLGLRVVGRSGRRLHPGVALLRAACCVLLPVGLFWVAFSRDNRSLQDLALRTAAVYDWPARLPVARRG